MNDRGRPKLVRRIDGTQLIANLAEVLERSFHAGQCTSFTWLKIEERVMRRRIRRTPHGPSVFAFGPPQVLGRVFALIDEMEYGWPRDVQVPK
jgi:hypothetical protein